MRGVLETEGKLGDSAHGVKAVALRVIAPFFRKHHEIVLPFTIKGTSSHPLLGLDLSPKHTPHKR
jgi:hypothetical protein